MLTGEERILTPQIVSVPSVLVKKGREMDIKQKFELTTAVEAPVESNQTLGKVQFILDGDVIGECRLTAPHYVEKLTLSAVFSRMLGALCKKSDIK